MPISICASDLPPQFSSSLDAVTELATVPDIPSPLPQFIGSVGLPSGLCSLLSTLLVFPFSLSRNQNILNSAHPIANPIQSYPPPQFNFCISRIPFDANRNPTPICNPQTTVIGTIIFTTSIKLVTPRSNTAPPVSIPAVVTDAASNPWFVVPAATSVKATAAIDFIG